MPNSITSEVLDGIVYTWRHPGIRSLYVMAFLPHLFVRPFIELLPGFSVDVFDRGTEGVAVLAGAFGLRSFIFGVVLAFRGRTAGLARINVLAVFFRSCACLALRRHRSFGSRSRGSFC